MYIFSRYPKKSRLKQRLNKLAKSTRWYRKTHRWVAIILVFFMFLVGVTGLLLTWKDELRLKPSSAKVAAENRPLISLQIIEDNAVAYIETLQLSSEINRIDYRPNKGIAKVRFEQHFTELQIDCYTGAILSEKTRTADIIEMIHDGSIIDYLFSNSSSTAKLVYSTFTSLGLLFLSLSGFVLWLRPKQMKKLKTSGTK